MDLYASTVPRPYQIAGRRNARPVFTLSDTVPNIFGEFVTVKNPDTSTELDPSAIVLTNGPAPCCGNPTALDTIALNR